MNKNELKDFLWTEGAKSVVRLGLLGMLAMATYFMTPIGSRAVSVWNSPLILEQILHELAANRRVVDWSPATRMADSCQRGETCVLIARFRRVQSAATCQIIPEASRFTFMSYADFVPRNTQKASSSLVARNIGTTMETVEIELKVPSTVPLGEGEIRVSSSYRNCAWQEGDEPPTSQVSPAFRVTFTD